MTTNNNRRFVVLGGVGAIGRVVVRDLFESHPRNRILIADFNKATARDYADSFRSRRVTSAFADARRIPGACRSSFARHAVVINCTQHDFNLNVMQAALAAKVHYLDLGGLFSWTHRQLKLNRKFKHAGLTAILGMGCSPGITNVMTRAAVEELEHVDSVRIRVGAKGFQRPAVGFLFPVLGTNGGGRADTDAMGVPTRPISRGKATDGLGTGPLSEACRDAVGRAHATQRSRHDTVDVCAQGFVRLRFRSIV